MAARDSRQLHQVVRRIKGPGSEASTYIVLDTMPWTPGTPSSPALRSENRVRIGAPDAFPHQAEEIGRCLPTDVVGPEAIDQQNDDQRAGRAGGKHYLA